MNEVNKKELSKQVSSKIDCIGIRVRSNRKLKNMTQQDLAFYCLADKRQVSEIERGACKNITLLTLFRIASVLDVGIDELFTGK